MEVAGTAVGQRNISMSEEKSSCRGCTGRRGRGLSPDVPGTLQRADAAFFPGGHRRAARGRKPPPTSQKNGDGGTGGCSRSRAGGLQRSRGERAAGKLL